MPGIPSRMLGILHCIRKDSRKRLLGSASKCFQRKRCRASEGFFFFGGGGGCSESSVDTPRGFPVRCRRMLDCVPSRRSSFVLFLSVFFPQFAFVAWSINSRQPSEDEPKRVKKNEQMTNDRFRVEWKTMATSMQFDRNRRLVTKSLRWAD